MKRKILVALLVFGLHAFGACSTGGTQTCTATGLIKDQLYSLSFNDSNGNEQSGLFSAPDTTVDISGIPSSVDCAAIDIQPFRPVLLAD